MSINAHAFDVLAREVFAPVYPVIAEQILARTGIRSGRCLDVGCGGGYLGLALVAQSDLELTLFDASEEMLDIACGHVERHGVQDRVHTLRGDVARIPMHDAGVDLAVSRGSIFFWKNPALAFAEIYRTLAVGGKAMIGGGFGSAALRENISCQMEARDTEPGQWRTKVGKNLSQDTAAIFEAALDAARIPNYAVNLDDETGLWITMIK